MKILVTGGTGFIGSHLTHALLERGHKVTVVDNFSNFSGGDFFENFDYRKKLIRGAKLIRSKASDKSVWSNGSYEVVAHLAALPVIIPKKGSFYETNIVEMEKVLKAAKKTGTRRFLFMSSIYAYGHYRGKPYREDMSFEPIDLYGASKAVGEQLTRFFFHGHEWVTVRTAGIVGFGDHNNRVFQLIVEKYKKLPKLVLTKKVKRIFVYIDDLVDGIIRGVESNVKNESFNIAGGVTTLEKFAKEAKKYLPDLRWSKRDVPEGEMCIGPASCEKAKMLLGFKPKYDLKRAVKEYVKEYKEFSYQA